MARRLPSACQDQADQSGVHPLLTQCQDEPRGLAWGPQALPSSWTARLGWGRLPWDPGPALPVPCSCLGVYSANTTKRAPPSGSCVLVGGFPADGAGQAFS